MNYFIDPILQASMWGTILMCFVTALVGTLAFVRRESLMGETLSHAAFPGAVIGVIIAMTLVGHSDSLSLFSMIIFAFLFSLLGMGGVHFLKVRLKIKEDAALCFILSSFMGIGIFITSILQTIHPLWYRQVQTFFYGQAATLMRVHVMCYALLAFALVGFLLSTFQRVKLMNFDRQFASSIGLNVRLLQWATMAFFALATVIGIKAVGVVLMSGMLIAPAIAARAWTHRLSKMFVLSSFFGVVSAMIGNILSYEIPRYYRGSFSLPTGPLILLVAAFIGLFSLFFSPKGLVYRYCRIKRFQKRCLEENFIKSFWKRGLDSFVDLKMCMSILHLSKWKTCLLLFWLTQKGEIQKEGRCWGLTQKGKKQSASIVRNHRLFELYLSSKLKMKGEMVHEIAEEMEHYITPEIEAELTNVLRDPKQDPHSQPIPGRN